MSMKATPSHRHRRPHKKEEALKLKRSWMGLNLKLSSYVSYVFSFGYLYAQRRLCVLGSILLLAPLSFGQEVLLDKNYVGYSKAKSSYAAKTEILQRSVKAISKEIIIEMIGEHKYQQNKALIEGKIIKSYAKYIPLLHQKAPIKKEKIYYSNIKLSISVDTLKAMLLKEGLLYESGQSPILLPMITFHIEDKPPFQWWSRLLSSIDTDSKIEKYVHSFHTFLQKSFFKKGFYIPRPHLFCFVCNIPSSKNFFPSQEIKQFARLFHSDLILRGEFYSKNENKKSFYLLNWQAIQAKDHKVLIRLTERRDFSQANLSKKWAEFPSFIRGASDRMANRVLLLWQQGRLGIQALELKLTYPVSIKDSARIKSLISQIRGVKSLNEYKVDHQSMSYFIYTTESAKSIAYKLSSLGVPYFQGKISYRENQITVQKKPHKF